MPKFSLKSLQRLSTCDNNLQALFTEVIKEVDCTIICGFRGEAEQELAWKNGNSQIRWPNSKHNCSPSRAVDVCPYPIDWKDIKRFKDFAKVVQAKAEEMGIDVEWGGEWVRFKDYPHWQLPD